VDLNVRITDVTDLYAYQFDIAFDPAIVFATGVSEGSFLSSGGATFFIAGTIGAGTITGTANTLVGPVPGVNGSGTLAMLRFQGLSAGTAAIALTNIVLLNSASGDISADVQNGSVTVLAGPPGIPEPSSALLVGSVIAVGFLGRYWLRRH
jgi:general secretion pathway protein D